MLLFSWAVGFGIMEMLVVAMAASNIAAFLVFWMDKRRAKAGVWRVRERTLLLWLIFCGAGSVLAMVVFRHKTNKRRFRFFAWVGLVLFLVTIAHVAHGGILGERVRFVELSFYSEDWPHELSGYRIGFMADFHAISHEDISEVVGSLNNMNIDILLLGGDFSMRNDHYLGTLQEIAAAQTTDGIFAVDGNHDDHRRLFLAMNELGIMPLDNGGIRVREGFFLAGVRDLWNGAPNVAAATAGANNGDFVLLLSHNPDVVMEQDVSAHLVLSGHTHGGQITFFGYPFYLLRGSVTSYGTMFSHGFRDNPSGGNVYITSGVGRYYRVPRMFTRPEVVIFTIL